MTAAASRCQDTCRWGSLGPGGPLEVTIPSDRIPSGELAPPHPLQNSSCTWTCPAVTVQGRKLGTTLKPSQAGFRLSSA